jgi:hypothetical protein
MEGRADMVQGSKGSKVHCWVRTFVASALVVFALDPGLAAQDKKIDEKTNVTGTWDMSMMSHQVGLVLEQEGTTVTGTLMLMGKDVPLNGEFADGKLSLVGKGALMARPDAHGGEGQQPIPIKLTGTLKDDGTLEGEMPGPQGTAKWTAERLKKRK